MQILFKTVIGYLIASLVAGSIMGVAFATNLGRRANKQQLESLQRIATYVPLQIDSIDGGLLAKPDERRPTIIYVHGRSGNRMQMAPLAEALFKEGYNAVLWDSKDKQISYGPKEIERVHKIIAALHADPHVLIGQIYVIGFSLGAAIAIGAASADVDGHIRGIVADSPYANLNNVTTRYVTAFGVIPKPVVWPARTITVALAEALHGIDFESRNPADWAARITCPVFLIHGRSDKTIPYTHSEEIRDRLTADKDLWLVEGAGHTKVFSRSPREYVRRVLEFLGRPPSLSTASP